MGQTPSIRYANEQAELLESLLVSVEDGSSTIPEATGQILVMIEDAWNDGYEAHKELAQKRKPK